MSTGQFFSMKIGIPGGSIYISGGPIFILEGKMGSQSLILGTPGLFIGNSRGLISILQLIVYYYKFLNIKLKFYVLCFQANITSIYVTAFNTKCLRRLKNWLFWSMIWMLQVNLKICIFKTSTEYLRIYNGIQLIKKCILSPLNYQ